MPFSPTLVFGAAALDHEALDDAMKGGAVIVAGAGELLEILDRLRRDVGPEGDGHFAVGGFDDGGFLGGSGSAHGIKGGANRRGFGAARTNLRMACGVLWSWA